MGSFDMLFGNESVKTLLKNELARGTLSHAYIVDGPKGSGRHTLVRAVLSSLAAGGDKGRIEKGLCADVEELKAPDGKKFIPVDRIRELREAAYLSPAELDFKAFIISEAQTMTAEAQNAFLKILEDPPDNVYFFLITYGPGLLTTVRSRAPTLRMQVFSEKELKEYCIRQSDSVKGMDEKNPKQLSFIIKKSGGAIGAVLDKAKSRGDLGEYDLVCELLGALSGHDKGEFFAKEKKIPEERNEYSEFLDGFIKAFRDILAVKQGISEPLLFFLSPEEATEYCQGFSLAETMRKLQVLISAKEENEYNINLKTARLDTMCRLWSK